MKTSTPTTRLSALFLRHDVDGAPLCIGQRVTVLCGDDDDSADERFHGCRGEVVGFLFDDPVKQLPSNPLVLVAVDGLGEEWFFLNELYGEPMTRVVRRAQLVSAEVPASA
jgi:hypothetical protein